MTPLSGETARHSLSPFRFPAIHQRTDTVYFSLSFSTSAPPGYSDRHANACKKRRDLLLYEASNQRSISYHLRVLHLGKNRKGQRTRQTRLNNNCDIYK